MWSADNDRWWFKPAPRKGGEYCNLPYSGSEPPYASRETLFHMIRGEQQTDCKHQRGSDCNMQCNKPPSETIRTCTIPCLSSEHAIANAYQTSYVRQRLLYTTQLIDTKAGDTGSAIMVSMPACALCPVHPAPSAALRQRVQHAACCGTAAAAAGRPRSRLRAPRAGAVQRLIGDSSTSMPRL